MKIAIMDIIDFLEKENIHYDFQGNKNELINGYSTLFNYREGTFTFISTLNDFIDYQSTFESKKIKLIFCGFTESNYSCFNNIIRVEFPKKTFFNIIEHFLGKKNTFSNLFSKERYTQHSFVSEKAIVGNNVKIGIGCVIEDYVEIGDDTIIQHNVVIKTGTKVGKSCHICSGVVIGETGFNPLKNEQEERELVRHYGGVELGNHVHIGDNTTISKGTIDDTVISNGVKINKQSVIAHNVTIGENTVITSPVFICGSVKIGENCHIAATAIRNQCTIGDGAVLGLGAVVVKDVPAGETVVGNPAKPLIKKG